MNRRREPLEEFPLDTLRMVGILERNQERWGLVQTRDGTVHRLKVGNYIGQNYGKIVAISEQEISSWRSCRTGWEAGQNARPRWPSMNDSRGSTMRAYQSIGVQATPMSAKQDRKTGAATWLALLATLFSFLGLAFDAVAATPPANTLEAVEFSSLPGDRVQITLTTSGPAPNRSPSPSIIRRGSPWTSLAPRTR